MMTPVRYRCYVQTAGTRDDVRTRLVETAARLLREHGVGGVTTRAVSSAAGVQAPTLYRLFGDKDGLLDAVAEHVMDTHVSAKAEVVDEATAAGTDPVTDLRAGWRSHVEFGLANPDLFRLLSDPGRATSSAAAARGQQVLAARVHRVAQAGRLGVAEERAVALVHAAGVGVVLTLLAAPPERRDRGLADQMCETVLAQVLVPRSDGSAGPVASAPSEASGGGPLVAAATTLRAAGPDIAALSPAERGLLVEWLDRVVAPDRGGSGATGPDRG